MKKLLLLTLVTVGISAATMSARAYSFGVTVPLGRPCPPIFVGPVLPIVAPPHVIAGGCEPTVIVRGPEREHGRFVAERFHNPVIERRDFRDHRDRF